MPGIGAHAAVESQLADQKESIDVVDTQRTVSAEDSDRDGQVEAGASFFRSAGARLMVMKVGGWCSRSS